MLDGGRSGLEVSLGDNFQYVDVEGQVGDDLLQPAVLVLELLEALRVIAFMPPYWAFMRCQVDSAISSCRQTSARSSPWLSNLSPSASFRITCSGV
jgi:hypothetical protein